jgi:plastocyanin
MRDDLRDRFFTPFVLPVTVLGVMLLFGISLARILLAVSELAAALLAMLAAGYIMAMAFFVEARRRIPPRALGAALAVGLIGLVAAGAVASAAGVREVEHAEEGGEGGQAAGGEGGGNPNQPLFVAVDIDYTQAPEALPPGDIDFTLDNQGTIQHDVTIEELGDETILDAMGGESDEATVSLDAGEYTYYCSVPGHRATMEGTLSIEEGVEASGGDAGEAASEGGSEAAGTASEGGAAGDAAQPDDDDESENAT